MLKNRHFSLEQQDLVGNTHTKKLQEKTLKTKHGHLTIVDNKSWSTQLYLQKFNL